ncbi:fimbria/pilus outer membrane usher protein [Burkholderia ubonensis]|uniref:fimbria/pilus outer membrane usher protein n=1 Tax=Burkholderia ubonensis TaxID=101571 RepID=UPI000AF0E667|nr:fimbria/pilus outer membrane usher protein [Burkholderia ubonensis]
MFTKRKLSPLGVALSVALYGSGVFADENAVKPFDIKTLEARGYAPELAVYFSRAPRFLPGTHFVTVTVNASRTYRLEALFDRNGHLCFNPTLLAALKLRRDASVDDCTNMADAWPGFRANLFPGQFRVELIVPEEAFDPTSRDGGYQSGGTAALVNYDVFAQRMDTRFTSTDYIQARIEPGLNLSNWVVRNRGVFTHTNGRSVYRHQEAYAQRSLESQQSVMQFGQFGAFGEGFGGLPVLGFQIGSDNAQTGSGQLVVPIQGIASSNATVTVRQRGRVVYRTVVAPGSFTLSNVGNLSGGVDIDVEVIEEDGKRSTFVVPGSVGLGETQPAPSWQFGIGRYRNSGDDSDENSREPLLAMGEASFSLNERLRLTASGLVAQGYRGFNVQSTLSGNRNAWLASGARYTHASGVGQGYEFDVRGSAALGGNLSGALSWLSRSSSYTTPEEAFSTGAWPVDVARFKQSAAASFSWMHPRWGAFSYVVTHNTFHRDNTAGGVSHALTVGRRFGRANFNLAFQQDPGGRHSAYARVSVPLGQGTVNANVYRSRRGDVTFGTTYDGKIGRDQRYSLTVSGNADTQRLAASTSMNTAYAQLGAGVSQNTNSTRSSYLSATGALVYADQMFGTASRRVGDTFAMVKVPGQGGLRVNAPSSTAITNASGTAVIPTVNPYTKANVQVDTRTLPMNVRLDTTALDLGMTRGSVITHRINATEVRQLLLTIRDAHGHPVAHGTSVLDEAGDLMSTVIGEGNVMLVNDEIGKPLRLAGVSRNECKVSYRVPVRFDRDSPYEEADATCE